MYPVAPSTPMPTHNQISKINHSLFKIYITHHAFNIVIKRRTLYRKEKKEKSHKHKWQHTPSKFLCWFSGRIVCNLETSSTIWSSVILEPPDCLERDLPLDIFKGYSLMSLRQRLKMCGETSCEGEMCRWWVDEKTRREQGQKRRRTETQVEKGCRRLVMGESNGLFFL